VNLRELCQIQGFPAVLLTTYNFDPLFFERVVLTDLLAGGAKKILVMADADQVYSSVEKAQGQLLALGRKYMIVPVLAGGAFHPKLCIRLSNKGGIVACGSHNLSRSGWLGRSQDEDSGGNREVTTVWRVEPDSHSAVDLRSVLNVLSELCNDSRSRGAILDLRDISWLTNVQPPEDRSWHWTVAGKDTNLASLLESRWEGRQFDRLRIAAGSTDSSAAMVRWAVDTFNIRQVILEIDKECCNLDPLLLTDLGIDFRLNLTPGKPRSHLKVAVFESDQSSAAVVGSANCSSAAWLRSSENSGNIESVVIYDECDPTEFHSLFLMKDQDAIPWHNADLIAHDEKKEDDSDEPDVPVRQLRQVQIEKGANTVYVRLLPNPPADQTVVAVVANKRFILSYFPAEDVWISQSVDWPEEICTPFAWVEIGSPGKPTNVVWIDDLDSLGDTSNWQLPLRAIRHLDRHMLSAGYRKLLNDLGLLSSTLLENTNDFQDKVLSRRQGETEEVQVEAQPVDPRSLIKSISDLHEVARSLQHSAGLSTTLTLTGIMRLFFYEAKDATESHDPTKSESKKSKEEEDRNTENGSDDASGVAQLHEPTEKEKRRLLQQLNNFVEKLSSAEFADRCSARQLQQAAAYPLAVAKFAVQGPLGQDIEEELSDVVIRVVEVLLKRRQTLMSNDQARILEPLLEEVFQRYSAEGRKDDFRRIIGDGVLWLVLTSSLTMVQEQGRQFELALLMRDVVQNGLLTATAIPERLALLARRLVDKESSVVYTKQASVATELVVALEDYLEKCWGGYEEAKRVFDDEVGDWLWRPEIGFVRITALTEDHRKALIHVRKRAADLANPAYLNYYMNIRQLQARDDKLRSLIDDVDMSIS